MPMLVKLKRRFASWWVPAIALFGAMFTVSSFAIGSEISASFQPAAPEVTDSADHEP